jgi:hypothetical protein
LTESAPTSEDLLGRVVSHYQESPDFNGIALSALVSDLDIPQHTLLLQLASLIGSDSVALVCGDRHPNPHIRALPDDPIPVQISHLHDPAFIERHGACVYPTTRVLETRVDPSAYSSRPFSLRLALGAPQLSHLSFDLSVLEFYREDPRYNYTCDDVSGSISFLESVGTHQGARDSDKVFLQTFGFSYDPEFRRAIAVLLRYLHDLSPEHQQIWNAKRLDGDYRLHPDYFRSAIQGQYYEGISIFEAFLLEVSLIACMSAAMGRTSLFSGISERPREFSFLLRPTQKAFNEFVQLLDKLMSDNIDLDFFRKDVPREREEPLTDGRVRVVQRGSIQIMEDWFRARFRPTDDPSLFGAIFATFREVRSLRSKPSHRLDDNIFDETLFAKQRELMIQAYEAIRTIRLILSNHPATTDCDVPEPIRSGRNIWSY